MPDRGRVIGGLAALVLFLTDKGDPISIEQAGICGDALELLKENEPTAPTVDGFDMYCGKCGYTLAFVSRFCTKCGAEVKWGCD